MVNKEMKPKRTTKYIITILAALLTVVVAASNANAILRLEITKGHFEPTPIAIADLVEMPPLTEHKQQSNSAIISDIHEKNIGAKIARVVAADLERSGLFRIVDKRAFLQNIDENFTTPRYADWRQINATALVTGKVTETGPGKIKVSFRLWDSLIERQLAGKEFNTFTKNWRRVAHLIADEVYKRITGEGGYFDSRIVYIAETGPARRKIKRLAIMDQDGENHKFLTNGRHLVLTPRFSPNTQEIIYLSYAQGKPRVYLRDLQTGREESLGTFEGMSFAPRFNHDGTKVIMSIAKAGNTEIYEMDLRTRKLKRLTRSPGIDTSPSYSPDGKHIVFNSDRGGSQQLYIMRSDGSGVKRISFGEGRYGTPVWSPRQDLIAFTKILRGRFYIGVIRPDGTGERLLTESWLDEGPSWSPNGRVIIFGRQASPRSKRQLYSIDVTGHNLRRVVTPVQASDPAWSPLLPM